MFRSVLVCLLLDLGEVAEARAEFEELAAHEFAALYRDNSWLVRGQPSRPRRARGWVTLAGGCGPLRAADPVRRSPRDCPRRRQRRRPRPLPRASSPSTLDRLDEAERHLTAADHASTNNMGARPLGGSLASTTWPGSCVRRGLRHGDSARSRADLDRRALATSPCAWAWRSPNEIEAVAGSHGSRSWARRLEPIAPSSCVRASTGRSSSNATSSGSAIRVACGTWHGCSTRPVTEIHGAGAGSAHPPRSSTAGRSWRPRRRDVGDGRS